MINIIKNIYFIIKITTIVGFYYLKDTFINNDKKNIRNCLNILRNENRLFIKLFQSLAYNNIYNKNLLNELNIYCEDVPYNKNELDHCLSIIPSDIYLSSNIPIASGLISLVFEGNYKDNKDNIDKLIIKIKRPNINKILNSDMEKIKFLLLLIKYLPKLKFLNLNDIFDENFNSIIEQTDFINEINNIKTFYSKNKNIDYVKIPLLIEKYSNNNCIVMKKIQGKKIIELNSNEKYNYLKNLTKFILKSLLFDGIYHSDLHSGNILFLNNYDIGIIDFGIIGKLTREEQNEYFLFFNYFKDNDKDNLIKHIISNLIEVNYKKHKNVYNYTYNYIDDFIDNLNYNDINNDNDINNHLFYNLDILLTKLLNEKRNLSAEDIININKVLLPFNRKLKKSFAKIQLSMAVCEGVIKNLSYNDNYLDYIVNAMNELIPNI